MSTAGAGNDERWLARGELPVQPVEHAYDARLHLSSGWPFVHHPPGEVIENHGAPIAPRPLVMRLEVRIAVATEADQRERKVGRA
jgi:hypothetical protein